SRGTASRLRLAEPFRPPRVSHVVVAVLYPAPANVGRVSGVRNSHTPPRGCVLAHTCSSSSSSRLRRSPRLLDLNDPLVSSSTLIVSTTACCSCAPRGQFMSWQGCCFTGWPDMARL